MTIITRNNYEEFFLDYIEGEIDAKEEAALRVFLIKNPDLKEELDEMMGMDLVCEESPVRNESSSLKEIPFQVNFDDFCVAHIEGDLDSYEEKAFEDFVISHPKKEKELKLYRKTKLEADTSILFTNKKSLKKRNKKALFKQFVFTSLATAASIAVLFSVWTSEIENPSSNLELELVSHNTPIKIVTPDSTKVTIPKEIKTVKNISNYKKTEKVKHSSKTKIKGKILNKQINKMDALPLKAQVSPKEPINKIKVKELLANNTIAPIEISQQTLIELPEKEEIIQNVPQNTGLAMLGISWKESKGEEDVRKTPTLLKIASYGVSQIGKLAGKKINLEKKYDPKTDKTRVAFNTYGIGFSAPVK